MSDPEFSHVVKADQLGQAREAVSLSAGSTECSALARRFGLVSIDSLTAIGEIWREEAGLKLEARMTATVTQSCVVTSAPVVAQIDEPVTIRFTRIEQPVGDEIELDADACDIMDYDGQSVDIGETVAQSLALALDPFPRADNAEAVLKAAGVMGEAEAGAFGSLAALRDQMTRR